MKIRILTTVLALLLLLGLTGCASVRMGEQIDRAEDAVENQLDKAEEAVENRIDQAALETIMTEPVPAAASPEAAVSATAPKLSREEAEKAALEHAGFTADQVKYLHTEYEIDDGRPQYEVSFHQGRWEYDYEIDAETGSILSFEKDD